MAKDAGEAAIVRDAIIQAKADKAKADKAEADKAKADKAEADKAQAANNNQAKAVNNGKDQDGGSRSLPENKSKKG